MNPRPMGVRAVGMTCPVGLRWVHACAAMRAGIDRKQALPYCDDDGNPLIGSRLSLLPPSDGPEKRWLTLLACALLDASMGLDRQRGDPRDRRQDLLPGLLDERAVRDLRRGPVGWALRAALNRGFEGKNVCRHLDLTTSNHLASQPGSTPPMPELESMVVPTGGGGGGEGEEEKCPCCGEPKHSNQQGAERVTEEEWYRVDAKAEESIRAEMAEAKRRSPKYQKKALPALEEDLKALEERRAVLAEMRELGCPSLPNPPNEKCGAYFKQRDEEKTAEAKRQWEQADGFKDHYKRWRIKTGRPLRINERVNHVVPVSAGGCPKGGKDADGFPNLVADGDIGNPRCLELDSSAYLGRAQSQAFNYWKGREQ